MAICKKVIVETIAEADDKSVRLMMVWFDGGGGTLYKVETDTDLHYDSIDYIDAYAAFKKALPFSDSWNLD